MPTLKSILTPHFQNYFLYFFEKDLSIAVYSHLILKSKKFAFPNMTVKRKKKCGRQTVRQLIDKVMGREINRGRI